jgi:hypothetical protein
VKISVSPGLRAAYLQRGGGSASKVAEASSDWLQHLTYCTHGFVGGICRDDAAMRVRVGEL